VVRNGRLLGIPTGSAFTPMVAEVAVALSAGCDAAVARNAGASAVLSFYAWLGLKAYSIRSRLPALDALSGKVFAELEREELRFVETLEKGEALLDELLTSCVRDAGSSKARIPGVAAVTRID